jgi:hypothetical protein
MSFMQHSHALKLDNLWVGRSRRDIRAEGLTGTAIKKAWQVEAAAALVDKSAVIKWGRGGD